MLYWHFRNLQCILAALLRPKLESPTAVVTKTFIANPFDSDWMSALQAGTFFLYTDAARWELAIRAGFLKAALKNKWVVILGGQKIIYMKPVKIWNRFQITMQFVGWDEKWIYAAHVFRQRGETKCVSFAKIGIRGRGKLVDPNQVFAQMGNPSLNPPPRWVLKHFDEDLESVSRCTEALVGA